jgi:hypothetical protein
VHPLVAREDAEDTGDPTVTASAVQVRRPLYSSSLGNGRRHAERLKPLLTRLAREIPEMELA